MGITDERILTASAKGSLKTQPKETIVHQRLCGEMSLLVKATITRKSLWWRVKAPATGF